MSRFTFEYWTEQKAGEKKPQIRGRRLPRTSTLTQKPETERTASDLEALRLAEAKRARRGWRNIRISLHGGFA